jgi:hypothetical protein
MDTVLELIGSDGVITLRCKKQKDAEPAEDIHMSFQGVELPDGTNSRIVVPSLPPQGPPRKSAAKTNRDNSNRTSKARICSLLAHAPDGMTPKRDRAAVLFDNRADGGFLARSPATRRMCEDNCLEQDK